MSRARDLSKLGNPNVIVADTERVGFGTQVPENAANASSSLISAGIVTATVFYGDGSNLEGVASAGLGTAVDDTKDSIGQNIYFTNAELSINENTTVNAPDTSSIAYTQYQQVTVESGSELIIADGDSFIPDVLGIGTALQASTAGAGNGLFGTLYVDNIENVAGRGGPNFPLGITVAGVSTFSGNVSIGGTLTYEDVTNVDSIGVVTARNGIKVTTGGIDVIGDSSIAGNLTLPTADAKLRLKDGNNYLQFLDTDKTFKFNNSWGAGEFTFHVNGGERLRIGSAGQIGLGGANYGTSGQVMTSQGASAAPQWASISATPVRDAWYQNADSDSNPWDASAIWGQTGTTNTKMARKSGFPTVSGQQVTFDNSNGHWTFPSTGTWAITFQMMGYGVGVAGLFRVAFTESTDSGSSFSYANSGGEMWFHHTPDNVNKTIQFRSTVVISNATTYRMKVLLAGPNNSNTKVKGDATWILYEKLT